MLKNKSVRIVISVLLWIIILLAAFYTLVTLSVRDNGNVHSIGGIIPMTVESDSMKPEFTSDDMIFVKKLDDKSGLKEGDIVSFYTIVNNKFGINTHRIDKVIKEDGIVRYITKGDANPIADEYSITDDDIVGIYVKKISGLGKIMKFLSSKLGFFLVILLPLALFMIYQIYHLLMVSVELKKAKIIEEAIENEEIKQQLITDDNENSEAESEVTVDDAAKALEEAKRLQAEAEAALAKAMAMQNDNDIDNKE